MVKERCVVVPRKGAQARVIRQAVNTCRGVHSRAAAVQRGSRFLVAAVSKNLSDLRISYRAVRVFQFEGGFAGWFVVLSMHPFVQGAAR